MDNRHKLSIGVMLAAGLLESGAAAPDFVKEVRPILEQHCVKCHGPEKQKGGLRFDSKDGTFKTGESGEKAIVPGHASESRFIKLITSKDSDEWMPPKGDRLSATEIELLKRWIDGGAEWPEIASTKPAGRAEMVVSDEDRKHWSYLPITSPKVPSAKISAWARTSVDQFIFAKLSEKELTPSTQADSRKLVRRIYFDLIGLPPTPAEVDDFLRAAERDSHAAVKQLTDQLLASPHYGERWARHWLDVARYADSDGQESDADRLTAYHFRDFVIRSLNDDLALDTFMRWQLAGDEFEPDNPLAIAATGFIVAGTHAVLDAVP